jgi:hypothetical protein
MVGDHTMNVDHCKNMGLFLVEYGSYLFLSAVATPKHI